MHTSRLARIEAALRWRSADATHVERMFFDRLNLWRDFLPGDLAGRLARSMPGETLSAAVTAEDVAGGGARPGFIRTLRRDQFHDRRVGDVLVAPRVGRFYPRSFLTGVPELVAGDQRPFRVLDVDDRRLRVDLNHPLAGQDGQLEATVVAWLDDREERGGRCNEVAMDIAAQGPGMQAALPGTATDFYADEPFARMDPRDDELFYSVARLVQHIDSSAISRISSLYRRFLVPGLRVLDLMSSWVSHLPPGTDPDGVTGLGMNTGELARNPQLGTRVVHDLNADPRLPFADGSFDLVVCTVSIEYLVRPLEVVADVLRVLRPGGHFVLTCSERWFPTKAIALWTQLHPFERLGLVCDYLRRAGFRDLGTETVRGLPRPADDPYADRMALADPVYAAWGTRPPGE